MRVWKRNFPRLFACIIGIDEYKSDDLPPLRSSVRHATQFEDYLTEFLCVPKSQIRMLIGEDASRNAIVDSLASLEDDSRINAGDPILIFFAGHTTDVLTPSDRQSGRQFYVQSLVPQDYCSTPGLEVPCIPDMTIGSILDGIADRKGNNITVILDCCHSVPTPTRGVNTGTRIRSIAIKENPDYASWHSNLRFQNRDPCSHILIAACSAFHRDMEADVNSKFLTTLLRLLRSTPPDKLRYSQIPSSIALAHGLKPRLEGVSLRRFLFGATSDNFFSQIPYTLRFDQNLGSHIIDGGLAHGITDGTTFDMKSDSGPNSANIGTAVVEKATTFFSFLKLTHDGPRVFPTLQSPVLHHRRPGKRPYKLRLFITQNHRYQQSEEFLLAILQDSKYDLCHHLSFVDHLDEAHLEVSVNNSRATFQLVDQRALKHGVHHRYPRIDPNHDKVASFLLAAFDYFWELDRTSGLPGLMDDLEVAFYPLKNVAPGSKAVCDADTGPEMAPLEAQNLLKDGEVNLVANDERYFGIKVVNRGHCDLFLVLQYFDCRSFGIPETYYPRDTTNLIDASINAGGGTLTIGYGSRNAVPLSYRLEYGQDIILGFLKIFAYTTPLGSKLTTPFNVDQQHRWGTQVIPIVQQRYPRQSPMRPTSWPSSGAPICESDTGHRHVHPLSRSRSLELKHV